MSNEEIDDWVGEIRLTHKWQREVLRGEAEEKNKMAGEANHDDRENFFFFKGKSDKNEIDFPSFLIKPWKFSATWGLQVASLPIPMDIPELETRNDTSAETYLRVCLTAFKTFYCVMAELASSSMS